MSAIALICSMSAGILWGCLGFFTQNISALSGLTSLQMTTIRLTIAAISFVVFTLIKNPKGFKISLKSLPIVIGMGVISVMATSYVYFMSIEHSSMAVGASLMYTAPAIVIIASRVLFKEKITKIKGIALGFAFVGACLVSGIMEAGTKFSVLGVVFGLLAGLFYASYSIFGTFALRENDADTVTVWTFIFAALSALVIVDYGDVATKISSCHNIPLLIVFMLGLGFISGFMPYLLYTISLSHTEPSKAAVVASVEPLVAAFVGLMAFGQTLTFFSTIGVIFIFVSVAITARDGK